MDFIDIYPRVEYILIATTILVVGIAGIKFKQYVDGPRFVARGELAGKVAVVTGGNGG